MLSTMGTPERREVVNELTERISLNVLLAQKLIVPLARIAFFLRQALLSRSLISPVSGKHLKQPDDKVCFDYTIAANLECAKEPQIYRDSVTLARCNELRMVQTTVFPT